MMWYWGDGVHWWGWLVGFLTMAAFFGVLVWGIWFVVTGVARSRDGGPPPGDAARILDERLARGEIDEDEYRRLRDVLQGRDRQPPGGGPADRHAPTGAAGR